VSAYPAKLRKCGGKYAYADVADKGLATDALLAVHALAFKGEPTTEQYALLGPAWNIRPD